MSRPEVPPIACQAVLSCQLLELPFMDHAKNNFDFLRILAAYLVLFSHQFSLTGHTEPSILGYQTLGGIALNIFFTLSGYLVAQSWVADPHPLRFALRRLLRIWPGLAAMVLIVLLILGPLLSLVPVREYFGDPETLGYLQILRLSIVYRLPGVFQTNPLPFVNGSLWTLPVEVRWYVFLMVFGLIGLIRVRLGLVAVVVAMAVNYFLIYNVDRSAGHGGDRWWNTELGIFFLAGACLFLYREVWERSIWTVAVAVALFALVLTLCHLRFAAFTLLMAFFVILVGTRSTPYIRHAGRWGDPSYGVYIYAFVIQQTTIQVSQNSLTFLEGLLLSGLFAGIAGFASWYLIEKPALRLKPRKRAPPADPGTLPDFGS